MQEDFTATAEERIRNAYRELFLTDQEITPYALAQRAGLTEDEFFRHFTTTDEVGKRIIHVLMQDVRTRLVGSETYAGYTVRERILTYFFVFFEVALRERSFLSKVLNKQSGLLQGYKADFKTFMADLVQEGISADELRARLTLSNYYPDMLWELHMSLLRFWLRDTSEHFVDTERAIEVQSKLPLELMGYNLLDSAYETAKFKLERLQQELFGGKSFFGGKTFNDFTRNFRF